MNRFEQLRASGDLPSPKGVALAVMRLTRRQDVAMGDLARVISGDPAFVGRTIKAANGLIALSRRPVASVQEALMVLGLPAVRTMVMGFSLLSDYREGACKGFDYDRFWTASLATGLAIQVIAERARVAAPDELFSVGLLSRVGELALATLYPGDYSRVIEVARAPGARSLLELEYDNFALNHCELTRAMLSDWGLPSIFVQAVGIPHATGEDAYPENPRLRSLARAMELARQIAAVCVAEDAARASTAARLVETAAELKIDSEALVGDCQRVVRLLGEWAALLKLRQPPPPDFSMLTGVAPVGRSAAPPEPQSAEPVAPTVTDERQEDRQLRASTGNVLRALVVDDEERTRGALRHVLEQGGFEVYEAANGRQGMERALEVQPQVLILDWTMPEMTGPELTRALRQTRVGQGIYMIQLSKREDDDRLVEAFDAGADDFIAKPVRPRALAARLRAAIRVARLQQELEREHEEIRHFAAQLAVTNRRLQEAALTDSLTGFANRRYAIDRIQQEWSSSTRWGRPLSCMIIDLDNFKQINDTYGHDVGDDVLRAAADSLRGALRGQDVICRTGGDEFLAICPETDLARALSCAERLRNALDALRIPAGDAELRISASIGVAMRVETMSDVDALMKEADRGAYLAKEQGRNCVATVQTSPAGCGALSH